MAKFEMIKYRSHKYPQNIPLRIEEIAAHLDVCKIESLLDLSLHTEYSYDKRKLNSETVSAFPEIVAAQKNGVPQLWKNEVWSLQFAGFIISLVDTSQQVRIIEIHPPFDDYANLRSFVSAYKVFESKIKEHFPKAEILIENRCGSLYRGGKFIISKIQDVFDLCNEIERIGLSLRIAYDLPQIYTAHNTSKEDAYFSILEKTKDIRKYIGGVHLWGKRLSDTGRKISHCGDLTSYFGNDSIKAAFLKAFNDCFDDDIVRKMVLEVNSGNKDLLSIIADL